MHWRLFSALLVSALGVAARRGPGHVGPRSQRTTSTDGPTAHRGVPFDRWTRDGPVAKRFANAKTTQFAVNGSAIPDVDFDIGEAYAGRLSISDDPDGDDKFYFWFQPSPNPAAEQEIVIWLNGGPGCSSLEGLLQENGPFLWQYGTLKPVPNPWGWHHLSNMLWVEQPINTGFSTGTVTATNEDDIAKQFMGFFKNFVDTFSMHGYKVYITGESYAGMYCPYIASAMLDANDTTYFNVSGMTIYDPVIGSDQIQDDITVVPFVDHHRNLFPFNDSFVRHIHRIDQDCGWADLRNKYLKYPPPSRLPDPLPGVNPKSGNPIRGCEAGSLTQAIQDAVTAINPCFDEYQVATTCPLLWDVLGFPGSFDYIPEGGSVYFDREDVKKAINAPTDLSWTECNDPVFVDYDRSDPSANTVLGSVIDRTKNVIIGHGDLDYVLIANGTLLAIQNMTFGGKLGFQHRPIEPFYVPYHTRGKPATIAAAGVQGTAHTERGLTFVQVTLSGHMIPQYAPSAAFRHLEFMLGRIDSLSSKAPFTTDLKIPQPQGSSGRGTAPPGYS